MTGRPKRKGTGRSAARRVSESAAAPDAVRTSFSERSAAIPAIVVRSTDAQNEFGRVFDRAMAGRDVAISKHGVIRAFLVSAERYHELVRHQSVELDALSSRFEQLYASMQRPEVRAATSRALRASPRDMGKAAVVAARRSRRNTAGKSKNR